MTSWQSLRLCGPSLCLSLKRRKAPSQTLCQTVQEMKERRMGNLFFRFSLPDIFTLSFLSPGHSSCEWPISHSLLLNFNIKPEHDNRAIELFFFFLTACGKNQNYLLDFLYMHCLLGVCIVLYPLSEMSL